MPTDSTEPHVRDPEPPGDAPAVTPRIDQLRRLQSFAQRLQPFLTSIGPLLRQLRDWVIRPQDVLGRIAQAATVVAVFAVVVALLASSSLGSRPAAAIGLHLLPSGEPSPTPTIGALVLGARSLPSANASVTPKARPSTTRKLTAPPKPEIVGNPIPVPTPTPSGSASPAPLTLQDYLKLVPSFPAAPPAVKVSLSHTDGHAAFTRNIPTTAPVAFLTIDDGWYKEPITAGLISQTGLPFTAFLTIDAIQDNVDFFRNLQSSGMAIEDHTVSHPYLSTLDLAGQEAEICPAADQLATLFGPRPLYFRPPYIDYNDDSLAAAWSCGITAGFGGELSFSDGVMSWYTDRPAQRLQPGDIVILHFDPNFPDSLIAALNDIKTAGLTPALLENWVSVS